MRDIFRAAGLAATVLKQGLPDDVRDLGGPLDPAVLAKLQCVSQRGRQLGSTVDETVVLENHLRTFDKLGPSVDWCMEGMDTKAYLRFLYVFVEQCVPNEWRPWFMTQNAPLPPSIFKIQSTNLFYFPFLTNLGLTSLHLDKCPNLRFVSDLGHLTGLYTIQLTDCDHLRSFPSLGGLSNLTYLTVRSCRSLTTEPTWNLEHLARLQELTIQDCASMQHPPMLNNLVHLTTVSFRGCSLLALPPPLQGCISLRFLDLCECARLKAQPLNSNDPWTLQTNTALETLVLAGCTELVTAPRINSLSSITSLDLSNCKKISLYFGLNPENLKELRMTGCSAIPSSPHIDGAPNLRLVDYTGCTELRRPNLKNIPLLTELYFDACTKFTQPPELTGLDSLKILSFRCCTNLLSAPDLKRCPNLATIYFDDCNSLRSPPDVTTLGGLTVVSFRNCSKMRCKPLLEYLRGKQLTTLDLHGCYADCGDEDGFTALGATDFHPPTYRRATPFQMSVRRGS